MTFMTNLIYNHLIKFFLLCWYCNTIGNLSLYIVTSFLITIFIAEFTLLKNKNIIISIFCDSITIIKYKNKNNKFIFKNRNQILELREFGFLYERTFFFFYVQKSKNSSIFRQAHFTFKYWQFYYIYTWAWFF